MTDPNRDPPGGDPPGPFDPDTDAFMPMRVGGVVIDPNTQVPVVILRAFSEPRLYIPIFVGGLEATSIATVLAGVTMPRPMTHDLMVSLLDAVACRVTQVAITKLDGGTFFAEIRLADDADGELVIDARPSDAIALALRTGAPVFVARIVVEAAGALAPAEDAEPGDPDAAPETDEPGEDDLPDMPPEPTPPGEAQASTSDAAADKKRPPADGPRAFYGEVNLEDLVPEDFGKYKM